MSDEQTKPREFWIGINNWAFTYKNYDSEIHVIEISALTALKKENEALKFDNANLNIGIDGAQNAHMDSVYELDKEIKSLGDELIDLKKERDQLRSGCYACEGVAVTNKKLSEQVEIAREALEQVEKRFHDKRHTAYETLAYIMMDTVEALTKLQSKGGE